MVTKRALTAETLQLFANNFGGMLIGFIGTVLVTRTLGPESRGIYAWVLTLQSVATAIALLTPYNTVRKLAAEDPSESNWGSLLGSITAVNVTTIALTFPLLLWALWQPLGRDHWYLLTLTWIGLPLTVAGASLAAFIHVRKSTRQTLSSMLVVRITTTALIVFAWTIGSLNLLTAVSLNIFISIFSFLVFLAFLDVPMRAWKVSRSLIFNRRHFLGAAWISGMTLFAMPKVPLLMLPGHASLSDIGHFSLATTLLDISLMFPAAITSVLVTYFTRTNGQQNKTPVTFAIAGIILLMAGCGYVLSPFVVPLVFGAEFAEAVPMFRLLLVALLLQIPLALWSSKALASSHTAGIVFPPLTGLVASLIVAWILIPNHGVYGAIAAVISSYAGQVTALAILSKRRAG